MAAIRYFEEKKLFAMVYIVSSSIVSIPELIIKQQILM